MKRRLISACLTIVAATANINATELLAYSTADGNSGLRFATRHTTTGEWIPIGPGLDFVRSDFGPWGNGKKMFAPQLSTDSAGNWSLTWAVNAKGEAYALSTSTDLIRWSPQIYSAQRAYQQETAPTDSIAVGGSRVAGQILNVSDSLIATLTAHAIRSAELNELYNETAAGDSTRFATLHPLHLDIKADPKAAKPISDRLIGIFFEDINHGADGGLYAELIQNRDFEYSADDRREWSGLTAWDVNGPAELRTDSPLHPNNPHYLHLQPGTIAGNHGYDGIPLKSGNQYNFSIKARTDHGHALLTVALIDGEGTSLSVRRLPVDGSGAEWRSYRTEFTPDQSVECGAIRIISDTEIDIDMVSLFPQDTFNGRPNGLRADLAQTLADLRPKFVRFPGGCVAHGCGLDNSYDWKGSVGPLECRRPLFNLWGYHQTRGLGYFEYFQFCEDIGAEPLPVVAAGVPCQNSWTPWSGSTDLLTSEGQQCGVPLDSMDRYIRDILDLVEYANGPADSRWGRVRAEAGHPEPFNLKYIGIGNEDMISPVFEERFRMIAAAVTAAYPEVEIIGTAGPFCEGTDYDAGWRLARELNLPAVDEHYYVKPAWMIYNQDFYDSYPRGGTRVYLGEYAAHLPDRASNIETALAEALYLTSVERNADVVAMTSYAPLLAKRGHTQWTPDLIYFDNTSVNPTVDYYVQQIYGLTPGRTYIPTSVSLSTSDWKARARVGVSVVENSDGEMIVRLVNMLPVAVSADIDGIDGRVKSAVRLAGAPEATEAKPESITGITLPSVDMPPYSFTVLTVTNQSGL